MLNQYNKHSAQTEVVVAQIRKHAHNLYLNRQMLCAEAVMVTLNQDLNGGLSESQAIAMAAPFSIAMGESGCLCGALSGAVMACGLFIGSRRPELIPEADKKALLRRDSKRTRAITGAMTRLFWFFKQYRRH